MERALSDPFERALVPLDRVRVRLLRGLMPWSGHLAGAREVRVLVVGLSVLSLSLGASLLAPLWLLALGPIVLGVPHLLADIRYCVVRPGWHRERALWLCAGLPLLALGFGAPLEYGLIGVAASALTLDTPRRARQAAVVLAALALAALARALGPSADLLLAHAHNFIAVGLWACWRKREGHLHLWIVGAYLLICAAILAGLGDLAWTRVPQLSLPTGLDAPAHLAILAPGLEGPWGLRLVLLYCFAQSVHYGVWLRLVPEEDRERPTPRSFRASYRSLRTEMSAPLLALFALAACALALAACWELGEARYGYLRFVRFHGVLELGALALLLVGGRRR